MSPSASLSWTETWSLLGLVAASLGIIVNTFHGDGEPLIASIAFSGVAFAATYSLIRWLGPTFIKVGLKGKDMAKPRRPELYVIPLRMVK
jgi:UDP-N-acetylglucosamine--dolichyl-phosphate N-acetylglucosaminephosphotransferase